MGVVTAANLVTALEALREDLAAVRLPLPVADGGAARADVAALVNQLDDYLLPRLRDLSAPLLAVVGGSTGSGKSTLVNALVGRPVTTPGVLRPTTRHPVLAHHSADADWFAGDRILPRLPRITGVLVGTAGADDAYGVRLVAEDSLPAGFAILDAPDLDSVSGINRDTAELLMAAADLWLFVTTAARYADAVPWHALRAAQQRNAAVVVVLNRVPPEAVGPVGAHVRELLVAEGMADAPLFVLPETALDAGMLPDAVTAELSQWLFALVADASTRAAIARRTLDGALANVVRRMPPIVDAVAAQVDTRNRLDDAARAPYDRAVQRLREAATDGSLMRGEVLARWQEFVGTGEVLKRLESGVGRLRDRVRAAFSGSPSAPEQVNEAIESRLASMIIAAAQEASRQAEGAWRSDPAGHALLGSDDLARASAGISEQAAAAVRGWQDDVIDLIRSEGADKRQTARVMAFGVNGTAAALMVAVFSMTGGLTGAEIGIAGGSALLAQKLLEAVFGEDAVRRMSTRAAAALDDQVQAVMEAERARFDVRLTALEIDDSAAGRLRDDLVAVEQSRAAETHLELEAGAGAPFRWDQSAKASSSAGVESISSEVAAAAKGRWRRRMRDLWEGGGL
jgi:hypothetical protein